MKAPNTTATAPTIPPALTLAAAPAYGATVEEVGAAPALVAWTCPSEICEAVTMAVPVTVDPELEPELEPEPPMMAVLVTVPVMVDVPPSPARTDVPLLPARTDVPLSPARTDVLPSPARTEVARVEVARVEVSSVEVPTSVDVASVEVSRGVDEPIGNVGTNVVVVAFTTGYGTELVTYKTEELVIGVTETGTRTTEDEVLKK